MHFCSLSNFTLGSLAEFVSRKESYISCGVLSRWLSLQALSEWFTMSFNHCCRKAPDQCADDDAFCHSSISKVEHLDRMKEKLHVVWSTKFSSWLTPLSELSQLFANNSVLEWWPSTSETWKPLSIILTSMSHLSNNWNLHTSFSVQRKGAFLISVWCLSFRGNFTSTQKFL